MNRILSTLLLLTAVTTMAFSQESLHKDKIELDPEVRIGKLDNGLTYYLRHNENPKNRAEFYIANNVGAMQEEDNQNGLAHFLEHLAFNGLKNFPGPKDMLDYLAANGVRFGYNVNAYTSRERTVYNISNVPLTREGFIDSVVLILHDWSSYILCAPDQLEQERGVIREEWRLGDDPRSRMGTKQEQLMYKGSKYAKRDVIGDFTVINTFERQTLIDFYHKWYRPDMQAVIIVGDFDVDEMEARVKRILSDLPKVENGAQKEVYTVPKLTQPLVSTATDPDIRYYSIKYLLKQRFPSQEELQYFSTSFKHKFARDIFTNMLGQRLQNRSKEEDCNYKSAVIVGNQMAKLNYISMMTITPKDEHKMLETTKDVMTEVQRVGRYGFYQDEFDNAKIAVKKRLRIEKGKKEEEVTNAELVDSYIEHFTNGLPFQNPVLLNKNLNRVYDELTLEDINALIPEMITNAEEIIMYSTNDDKADVAPKEAETLKMISDLKNSEIKPLDRKKIKTLSFDFKDLKGSPVKKVKELGINNAEIWTLENGINVIWTPTPEMHGDIQMALTGTSKEGLRKCEDIKVAKIAASILNRCGVQGLTRDELDQITAKYSLMCLSSLGKDQNEIRGTSSVADFEKMMALVYMKVTDPYFDSVYLAKQKIDFFDNLKNRAKELAYAEFSDSAKVILYNHHPLTKRADSAAYARITIDDVKQLHKMSYSNLKSYTFFITGTMNKEEVKPLVEKYIGSLPVASAKYKEPKDDFRFMQKDFQYIKDGRIRDIPKANVTCTYHGDMKYTVHNNMVFKYVKQIMWLRYILSIREDKGGAYSISSDGDISPDFKGWFSFVVGFQTDPKLVDDLVLEVDKGLRSLAENGPTAKEMEATTNYLVKAVDDNRDRKLKNINFWTEKSMLMYQTGLNLNEEDIDNIKSVTPAEIQKMAQIIINSYKFTSIYKEQYPNK